MNIKIKGCESEDVDGVFKINIESNLFATAQFMTSPKTIEKTMRSAKNLMLVAKDGDDTVGYILGKMKTRGVFYNELLGVTKDHRRHGIGGALIISFLKMINEKKSNAQPNKFWGWKWSADVPAYNFDALQMYKAMEFTVEGCMKRHTSAKTDIYIISFFLDERKIPEYGVHLKESEPAKIDDSGIMDYLKRKNPTIEKEADEKNDITEFF
jgi:ribosomal protein S18 acetylase RimI-like enzyme